MIDQDEVFSDPNMFVFSFESHGRCETPQWFPVKEWRGSACVRFYMSDCCDGFVLFGVDGVGNFSLGNEGSVSNCQYLSETFEGLLDTTLTGKCNYENFTSTRLVAIQLE